MLIRHDKTREIFVHTQWHCLKERPSPESFSRKMGQLQFNLIDSAAYRSTIRAIQRN